MKSSVCESSVLGAKKSGLPPLCPNRPKPPARQVFYIESSSDGESTKDVDPVAAAAPETKDGADSSPKHRLRPRKVKVTEPEVVITEVRAKGRRSGPSNTRRKTATAKPVAKKRATRVAIKVVSHGSKKGVRTQHFGGASAPIEITDGEAA